MSTPLETALKLQAQKNEANQKALRVDLGLGSNAPVQATAGFTLANIGNSITSSLADPDTTGWMFLYQVVQGANGPSNDTLVSDIIVRELKINLGIGTISTILETPALPLTVNPFIHIQRVAPGTASPSAATNYPDATAYTGSGYVPFPGLKTSRLSYFSEWTRAAFIRRTDLTLLRDYLLAEIDDCDDVFFSGAFLDYDSMQNARLRVEQLNTPGIDNISQSFTLKAEPISFMHADILNVNETPPIPGPGTGTGTGAGVPAAPTVITDSSRASIPLSFTFVPCPPYWHAGEVALKEKAVVTGGYSSANTKSLNTSLQDQKNLREFIAGKKIKTATPSLNLWAIIGGGIIRLFSIFKRRPEFNNHTNLRSQKE